VDKFRERLYSKLGYKPFPSQVEGHESGARYKSLFAGSRYGKSLWASKEVLPDIMQAKTRGWIVGPNYEQPSKEFRYIHEDICIKLGFKPQKVLNPLYSSPGPQVLITRWGSEVHTKSEDAEKSLLGEEIDWLILSEGSRLKEKTYDAYLRARLGTRIGRVIIPTTPHGYNWLYKRFYLPAKEDGNPDYWAKIIPVIENPYFSKEEYLTAKRELPTEIFEEQYNGNFVAFTGLIYKRFGYEKHVIPAFKIPKHWGRYMSIDPHPQTPVAVLWIAIDEHGTMYIYDEMFIDNLTIPEVASHIRRKECEQFGIQIENYKYIDGNFRRLIDPNAKFIDKLRGQTASIQAQFRSVGVHCIEANNKFEHAYYKISELLTPKSTYGEVQNLTPRLFVFNHCKETIHEFMTCDWDNEKDNHMLDNLKYIVNDNPVRTYTQDELEKEKQDEVELLQDMGRSKTGYG